MDSSKPAVIVNPRSGGGLSERTWAALVAPLTDGLGPFDTLFTQAPGDAQRIAREQTAAGRTLIVAFGGDGTISEAANGVLDGGGQAELGIIPRGTGGDFRRSLELPSELAEAARRARSAPARTIDAGRVTLRGPDGAPVVRHFVNVASFGFSADVAGRANRSSKRFGAKASFLGATVRALFTYDNPEIYVSLDGGERQRRTLLLGAVGNGRFFGGGMQICPDGCLDDGLLDVVLVGDLGRVELVKKINRIYEGTHLEMKEVSAARARMVQVTAVDETLLVPLELDGETPGTLPAKFEVVPRALKIRF